MPAFFSDTFTEASNTSLASHTPNTGTSWTLLWNTTPRVLQVESVADQVRGDGNGGNQGIIYTADATYPSANYEVEFTLVATITSIVPVYVFVRIQDQENMYAVRLVPSTGTCRLYKKVSGTWTALGSLFDAPANGSVCKLSINGTALKFYDDGVEVASATDSDISAAGKAGLGMGGGTELVTSTDDISATNFLDNFSVTDLGSGGTTYTQSVSGSITPTGALLKQTGKSLSGSVSTISGTLSKSTSKNFSGSITPTGGLTKQASIFLSGAVSTIEGAVEGIKIALISISGSITPSGSITKSVNKNVSGGVSPSGDLSKHTSKSFSGNVTPSGDVSKQTSKSFSGNVNTSGALLKSVQKVVSGSVSSIIGVLTKQTNKSLSGSVSPIGAVSKSTSKILSGIISSIVGVLTSLFSPAASAPQAGHGESVKANQRENISAAERRNVKHNRRRNI